MSLRRKIIKLALENPEYREDLLGTLSSRKNIREVAQKFNPRRESETELLTRLLLDVAQKSYDQGKSEVTLSSPINIQPQVQVQQAPGNVIRIEIPVPGMGGPPPPVLPVLPMKPPDQQTYLEIPGDGSPAPAMPTDPVRYNQNLPQSTQAPMPGMGTQQAPTFMPPDQRQLHEILERFKTLNNVDKDQLGKVMQNVLDQMPDNNLRRRLHSYMETAKHELL